MRMLLKKDKHHLLIVTLIFSLLASCMVEIPSYVIQPDEMEDLLYDYHLMQAMAGDLTSSQNHKRKIYEESVFAKHHVTEAEFDTSLTWYMRNTKELETIYKNLNKRFSAKKEEMANYLPPNKRMKVLSPAGDSVNIWTDYKLFRLSLSTLSNKLLFQFEPDSNYQANDSFVWNTEALFLGDTCKSHAIMSMTFLYDKDTVGLSQVINHSGTYTLSLACNPSYKLKEIVGHIYYFPMEERNLIQMDYSDFDIQATSLPTMDLLLSNISFIRKHKFETSNIDTLQTIKIDNP